MRHSTRAVVPGDGLVDERGVGGGGVSRILLGVGLTQVAGLHSIRHGDFL